MPSDLQDCDTEDGDWDWAGSRKDDGEKTLVLFDGDIAAITKCARSMMHCSKALPPGPEP